GCPDDAEITVRMIPKCLSGSDRNQCPDDPEIRNQYKLSNSGQWVTDQYYDEIISNLADYRQQYEMCGYELVERPGYLFIREITPNATDLKTDVAMKASLLILMLAKYITDHNYSLLKLTETNGGVTPSDIEAMQEMPDMQELIEKAKLNSSLFVTGSVKMTP
ncbi:MAG: hypothetical protein COB75_00895, partial [Idiomarina sp.]